MVSGRTGNGRKKDTGYNHGEPYQVSWCNTQARWAPGSMLRKGTASTLSKGRDAKNGWWEEEEEVGTSNEERLPGWNPC
jgi:hypothetical protein